MSIEPRWEFWTDLPLAGLRLARESGEIFAWDQGGWLYRLGSQGSLRARWSAGKALAAVAPTVDGRELVAASSSGDLWWLSARDDGSLNPVWHLELGQPLRTVAIDTAGVQAAVVTAAGELILLDPLGRRGCSLHCEQAPLWLTFCDAHPLVIGATETGYVVAINPRGQIAWQRRLTVRLGGLAIDARGGDLWLAAYHQGLLRLSITGEKRREITSTGALTRVSVSADGAQLVCAELGGRLSWLGPERTPIAGCDCRGELVDLAMAPLGNRCTWGTAAGHLVSVDLASDRQPARPRTAPPTGGAQRARASWRARLATPADEAPLSRLAWLDSPCRIAALTARGVLEVYDPTNHSAKPLHSSEAVRRGGRFLWACDQQLLVFASRQLLLYDPGLNQSEILPTDWDDLSQVLPLGQREFLMVEEHERISRVWNDGERSWSVRVPAAGQVAASGQQILVTSDERPCAWFSLAGEPLELPPSGCSNDLLVSGSEEGFFLVDRPTRQVLFRDHEGRTVWREPLDFEPWRTASCGNGLVIRGPQGEAAWSTTAGPPRRAAPPEIPDAVYYAAGDDPPVRAFFLGGELFLGRPDGSIRWRSATGADPGPIAISSSSVAAISGSDLYVWQGSRRAGQSGTS